MKHGKGKGGTRLIFEGSTEFDSFELQEIEKFKEYIRKNKKPELEFTDDSRILRYLQACGWKLDKTYQSLLEIIPYCKSLPIEMTPMTLKYLVSSSPLALSEFSVDLVEW